jgi:hypothetical protein
MMLHWFSREITTNTNAASKFNAITRQISYLLREIISEIPLVTEELVTSHIYNNHVLLQEHIFTIKDT